MSKHKRKYRAGKRYTLAIYNPDVSVIRDVFIIRPGQIQLVGHRGDGLGHYAGSLGKIWNEEHSIGSDMHIPTEEELRSIKKWLPRDKWNFEHDV